LKALVVKADWEVKSDYPVTDWERKEKIAFRANMVFKNPEVGIEDVPEPRIGRDEVKLEVKACGVCGSDVHMIRRDQQGYVFFGGWAGFPCVLGHEFSGIVTEVGSEVRSIKPGDLVTAEEIHWCGICDACRSGWFNCCKNISQLGFETRNPGALAEYVKVKEKYAWKLDPLREAYSSENDILEAGSLVEPTSVCYEGIFTVGGGIRPGGHVAVFGAGPIGLASIQLLKTAGAAKIIVFEPMKKRAEWAKMSGADYVFDPTKPDQEPATMVRDVTDGEGCAMLVEAAGVPSKTIPPMLKSVGVAGKIVVIGMGTDRPSIDILAMQYSEASIYGTMGHSGHRDFGNVINLMGSRRINVLPIITNRYPLNDAMKAVLMADQGDNAKATVKP
jgi:threonine dehydrogenase-like Zn-dependent dehydrogenase